LKQIAIVYYSGTGNTEALAQALAKGVQSTGATTRLISAGLFSADMLDSYDGFAFGCPAMGSESLEDEVFEPMFDSLIPFLSNKKVALFGSYGWGDGQWMQDWAETTEGADAIMAGEPVIALDTPDKEALVAAYQLGIALAS